MGRGAERKLVQNAFFRGKRHDNEILKAKILLSKNFVVMAQAPKIAMAQVLFPSNFICVLHEMVVTVGGNLQSTNPKKLTLTRETTPENG